MEERPKAKGKGLTCYVCGGTGHPASLCTSGGWVNDLEQDAPEGDDTNEDGCWTEADDETLQLGYLGSESGLMSSPPGLRDAFSEAGWTVVTRKSRNRQQCSRRRGCFDMSCTVLGSLWDDDNDRILGQVADDRTRKGMVKISAAVVDVAEANVIPENMMQWIPLKPSTASRSGKIFRGEGRDPIPARGERSVIGRTDEGQSRRTVWEVCPVKLSLLSVAKISKAGNQVYSSEDKAFVKNNKTEQITNLRRERNEWMLDLWVKRPADAMDVSQQIQSPSSVEPEVLCCSSIRPVSDLEATESCVWLPSPAVPWTSGCGAKVFFVVVVGGTVDQGAWTLATVREDGCLVRGRHGHRQSERVTEQHGHVRQSVCISVKIQSL